MTYSCKIVIPVRLPSWLSGDLGNTIEQTLKTLLRDLRGVHLTRLQRGFLVEASESTGPMLEAVQRAVFELERRVEEAFPVLHVELGPVWTGTLQAIFYQTPKPGKTPHASTAATTATPPTETPKGV
ncbi:MAG: hypothetical protein LC623_08425 [Halobacteriales archaeon]|nr:hypothetical protein [Halobacteriales archaeon]